MKHKYKIGDPVRVIATGELFYFAGDVDGELAATSDTNLPIECISECGRYDYHEIEPLPLRHPYYGKMVLVWDNIGAKPTPRILIDVFTNGCCSVGGECEDLFKEGKEYPTARWDHWKPIEADPVDIQAMRADLDKIEAMLEGIRARLDSE